MPAIWLEGWARQRWLERYFDKDKPIRSLSAEAWSEMIQKHEVITLVEKAGNFEEITEEDLQK